MPVAAFDTLAFVKRMTAAGMPDAQAEALADEQNKLFVERLATKEDLKLLETALRKDMIAMEERITLKLTVRLGAMMFAAAGGLAVLMKLLQA